MTASIAERVAAGAAWLDENRPGWVERIDLETLDLGDPCRCVLGQEYGRYGDAPTHAKFADVEYYGEDWWIAPDLGFDVESVSPDRSEYHDLTAEWRRLITARRVLTS